MEKDSEFTFPNLLFLDFEKNVSVILQNHVSLSLGNIILRKLLTFINCPPESSLVKRKIEYRDIDRKTLKMDTTLIDISEGSIKFNFKKPFIIYDLDGKKSTRDDQVTISGEFELDDSLESAFDIMNRSFKDIKLTYQIKETSKLSINSNISKKIDKKERIIRYNLFSFRQVICGIPFWFTNGN